MDPDVALQALIAALTTGDVVVARGHFADLDSWLSRGGFPPPPPPQLPSCLPCARCGWDEVYQP